ncbi:exonuclease [Telmatospirillum sp. J64-1]|uniref:exonuclease n=1 Tax=Telmatospirillum sp. J64-1 TaxID=2502183 RepID=UPI00115E6250|nr:exonuclease [Telmatospirillum sp. J64-1]
MTTLLIDGDIIAYQVAAGIEKPIHWGDDLWTLHSDAAEGRAILDDRLTGLLESLDADRLVIALTDGDNWRKEVYPSYKTNRAKIRKPVCLPEMRRHLSAEYETFQRPGLEGDDVLGILATHPKLIPGEKIVVSIDKDMKTIPGLHYNLSKDDGVVEVSEAEADYWHLFQTLTGDQTDGYPGCPGIGPKKAEDILKDDPSWERVVTAYVKAKLTEDDAIVQARVARILRYTDYDFKKKRPILWTP